MNELPPDLAIVLPMPPSVDSMYINMPRKGRVLSSKYRQWKLDAGAAPLHGNWLRLVAEGQESPIWDIDIRVCGLRKGSDLDNRLKATIDLICEMTGLEDNKLIHIEAWKQNKDSSWHGACVAVTVRILHGEC